ncbi:MAG: hypothetical protein AAFV43_08755, partial [Planctomycetota bacterium]
MVLRVAAGCAAAFAVAVASAEVAQPEGVADSALTYDNYYAQPEAQLDAVAQPPAPVAGDEAVGCKSSYSGHAAECAAAPGCDALCGDPCCGDACGCGSTCGLGDCSLMGGCCLGDAWTLKGALDPCDCLGFDFGGWTQIGYHSNNIRLSQDFNDGLAF